MPERALHTDTPEPVFSRWEEEEAKKHQEIKSPSAREDITKVRGGAARRKSAGGGAGGVRRYGIAILCVLVAFGIRYWLTPVLGEELPFMLFIAAALIAAWYGGAATGIVALLLGLFLADHFFLFSSPSARSLVVFRLLRYCFTASLGIGLIEVLHRGRRRMAREIRRREESEQALWEARNALSQYTAELEDRVEERTRALSDSVNSLQELLYQIAHNMRAPLRAMEGYSHVLLEDCSHNIDSRAQQCSQRISTAAKRMDQLIQDVLEYGRLSHIEIKLATVSLKEVIDRTLSELADRIHAINAEIIVDAAWPEVIADRELVVQALCHLLDNALTFVSPGTQPRIRIWAESRESAVRLWIEDNGLGIEPRYQERIFDLFETINPQDPINSTGVGLAIVKRAVLRMNGRAGVESQPGSGSRFWIELPEASMDR